jgi:chromosome segregation ATPase
VGWGNGLGDLSQWTEWQVPQAFVIEAEEGKRSACQAQALALAQANGQAKPSWQTIHATLAAQGGEMPYHVASNPSESGLVPTETLRHAWPYLQTVASPSVVTRSLDEVWQDISMQLPLAASAQSTWLIIDCLPATDLLSGGVTVLSAARVVCARSLLANRALLCDQMRAAGWLEVGWSESQHPAFGHAWFTRDTALELDQAAKREAQLVAERNALTTAKDAETAAKNQALAERDAMVQAKTALQNQLGALEKAITESQAQLGIHSQAQSDLQGQLRAMTQAQVGLQSELDSAAKKQAQLAEERDALAKAKEAETQAKTQALAERDAMVQAKTALQNQLGALEKAMTESQAQLGIHNQTQTDLQGKLHAITQAQMGLQSELESAAKDQAQLAEKLDALAKVKDAETQAKTQALAERDALAQAKTALQNQLGALEKAMTESQAQLGIHNQTQTDLQGQLGAITQAQLVLQTELDNAAKRYAQLLAERDALIKAKDFESTELAQRHEKEIAKFQDQVVQEKKSRTDLQKQVDQSMGKVANQQLELQSLHSQLESQALASTQLAQRNAELAQLQVQLVEAQKRQMLMNDALLKSEAQIELIKDLCLREPGI